jgi:hypothetical protein
MGKFKRIIKKVLESGPVKKVRETFEIGTPEEVSPTEFAAFHAEVSQRPEFKQWQAQHPESSFGDYWSQLSEEERWDLYNAWKRSRGAVEKQWYGKYPVEITSLSASDLEKLAEAEEHSMRAKYLKSLAESEERKTKKSLGKEVLSEVSKAIATGAQRSVQTRPKPTVRYVVPGASGSAAQFYAGPRMGFGPPKAVYSASTRAGMALALPASRAGSAVMPSHNPASEAVVTPAATLTQLTLPVPESPQVVGYNIRRATRHPRYYDRSVRRMRRETRDLLEY